MKSKLIVLALGIITLFVIPIYAKYQQPTKEFTVSLTIQEWNTAIYSITNPDDVTPNQKKSIAQKMIEQLNKQIADTTKPKK